MRAAETMLSECYEARKAELGEGHSSTLRAMNALASCCCERGDFERAEPLYRQALTLGRGALGDSHPVTLTAMNNLGNFLHALALQRGQEHNGDKLADAPGSEAMEEAASLLRESLERSRRLLGARSLNTLITGSNFGACLRSMGKLDEAAVLIREAVEGVAEVAHGREEREPDMEYVHEGLSALTSVVA